MSRDISREAWCWYHRNSETFFQGAVDACETITAFFREEALKRGMGKFGYNGQIYDTWRRAAVDLAEGINRVRLAGDYQLLYDTAVGIEGDVRGIIQSVFLGWLEDAEPEYNRLQGVASNYAGFIQEGLYAALRGGAFWRDNAATATPKQRAYPFGPVADCVVSFFGDRPFKNTTEYFPHFLRHPVPKVLPIYEVDQSRPVKAGETVPWTGVWYPALALEEGIERYSLTFAVKGYPMQPAWKLLQTPEEYRLAVGDATVAYRPWWFSPKVEVCDMTWFPLLEAAPVKAPPFSGRVEGGQPCPREGYWWSPAVKSGSRFFKEGEIMPKITSTEYAESYWLWGGEAEKK